MVQRTVSAQAALAGGDLVAARRWVDEAVTTATGWWLMWALTARARVAIAQGEPDQAERDAHEALACAADIGAYLHIPNVLECLAVLASDAHSHREAARFFGAAHAVRLHMGAVRFKIYDADYQASVAALRDALGEQDFDAAWAEGATLSTEEAIAYAQRGRGQRKRPTSGWAGAYSGRARRRATGQQRTGQQRHREPAVRLTAHRANAPHPRLRQTRPQLADATTSRKPPAITEISVHDRLRSTRFC